MTEKELEGNKTLAKFIGGKREHKEWVLDGYWDSLDGVLKWITTKNEAWFWSLPRTIFPYLVREDCLSFHKNWNALMYVVNKIKQEGYEFSVQSTTNVNLAKFFKPGEENNPTVFCLGHNIIDSVFNACVKCVEDHVIKVTYRLINPYPGKTIGDTCIYNPNISVDNFIWESDNAIIPVEFQPDLTPEWFEKNMKVRERIYVKETGCRPWFRLYELPKDILPDDIIELDYDPEGFYSENESWDPYSRIIIDREREETEEEEGKRKTTAQREADYRKNERYKVYLNLKKEFEDGQ